MLRLILCAFVVFLLAISGLAVALVHFWDWKGLVAFPFLLVAIVWFGVFVVRKLFQRFLLGLFSMKSRVLRGAKLTVHSVAPVADPLSPSTGNASEHAGEDADDGEAVEMENGPVVVDAVEEPPREYFDVDLTITPKDSNEGRVWEPGELLLTSKKIKSLMELDEGESALGTAEEVQVWDGHEFGPDDPGKYPGEQRLKVTFGVKPGTTRAWLCYYSEALGEVVLGRV